MKKEGMEVKFLRARLRGSVGRWIGELAGGPGSWDGGRDHRVTGVRL